MASALSSSIATMARVSDPVEGIVVVSSSFGFSSAEMESCCSGMSVGTAAVDDVANEMWCPLRDAILALRPPARLTGETIERASTRTKPLDADTADATNRAEAIVPYLWGYRAHPLLTYPSKSNFSLFHQRRRVEGS